MNILIFFFFLCISSTQAYSDPIYSKFGNEIEINPSNKLSSNPSMISLSNGDMFVITWSSDNGTVGRGYDIFAQIFYSCNATEFSDVFLVNTFLSYDQKNPSIASLNIPNMFIIVWESLLQDDDVHDIYGQLFYNNGTMFGDEFQVNNYNISFQMNPSVTSLSNGNMFVITWDSNGQDGSGIGVYAQIFHNNGTKFESEFLVNTYTANNQLYPSITSLSNNDMFVITWSSYNQDGSQYGIYAQIFHNNGTISGSEFHVNNYKGSQNAPSIASLSSSDKFVITWEFSASNFGIHAQIFHNNGTISGEEFVVGTESWQSQRFPQVASLSSNDEFVITYSKYINGSHDIFAQVFHNNGTSYSNESRVNTQTLDADQEVPSITSLSNDMFAIAWNNNTDDFSNGIFAQLFGLSCDIGSYLIIVSTKLVCTENTAINCYEKSKIMNTCLSCIAGYGFANGTECIKCEIGYYSLNGITTACYENTAINCYEKSKIMNTCLSCIAGYGANGNECIACEKGYYSLNGTVAPCYENTALNCATKSTIAHECLSCVPNYGYDALLGTCTFCYLGTTDTSGTSPCFECPVANCTDCDMITYGCNECSDLEVFRYSGPKGALGTICVLDCPSGYFGTADSVCKLCPTNLNVTCRTCDSNTGGCTTCQEFNEWLSGGSGLWDTRCVVDCNEDEVKDFPSGYNASCISQCPDGQYSYSNEICIDCDSSCVTCDSITGGCLTCKEEGEWLSGFPGISDTLCVVSCKDKVKDYASGVTAQCIEECEPGYRANANEVCPNMSISVITIIYIVSALFTLLLFIVLIVFIGKLQKIENQHPFTVFTVFIAIYDFITDTLLLASINREADVAVHYYIGSSLLMLSIIVNIILLLHFIIIYTRKIDIFKIWLRDRTALFGIIFIISATNLNVCSLWTSRLCGLRIFDAPIGDYEYQLKGLGIVSHVMEDIPQLAIQLSVGQKLYGLSVDKLYLWPPLLILAMSATILSLACGLFSRGILLCISRFTDMKTEKLEELEISVVQQNGMFI